MGAKLIVPTSFLKKMMFYLFTRLAFCTAYDAIS